MWCVCDSSRSTAGMGGDLEFSAEAPMVQSLMTCLSPLVRLRCQYEWFYSTIDRSAVMRSERAYCMR